jgi:hypothetical protein
MAIGRKDVSMTHKLLKIVVLSATIGIAATGVARADCETDMFQLEQALKAPNLTAASRTALDEAKTKAVAALKKDDDAVCHKAIADGMSKAGMTLK